MLTRRVDSFISEHAGRKQSNEISVIAGIGQGTTALSAFDAALGHCSVLICNLIRLSSVILLDTKIEESDEHRTDPQKNGDRLSVVVAEQRSITPGAAIAAEIGWCQRDIGRGVFVEHEEKTSDAETVVDAEAAVLDRIYASLSEK